jgi:peptide deformylase
VSRQVFVWEWTDDDGILQQGAVINPTLAVEAVSRGKPDPEDDQEGCLSVPDFRYPLTRAKHVILEGISPQQEPLRIEASGWLARIFQHEFDHLQGTLYVDRLRFRLRREARSAIKEEGWGVPGVSWLPGVDGYESHHEAEEA